MRYDYLMVGAGFTGVTLAERLASQLGLRVLVIDRRGHVAGNAYDGPDASGQRIHHYGAHIFHTASDTVWEYLSGFTKWRPYEHRVLGVVEDRHVPIPFNLTSLHALFPRRKAVRLETRLIELVGMEKKVPVLSLIEHPDRELAELGDYIYENVFANYTAKQWGMLPEHLDRTVTGRVPIHVSYDDRYFQDRYQAMPSAGYLALFERMLAHPNIEVELGVEYEAVAGSIDARHTVFTGPIDELFGGRYGLLPYRSLRFEHEVRHVPRALPAAVVNHPNAEGFTRVLEHKWLTGEAGPDTVVTTEWPQDHVPGRTEPFYPVPKDTNRALHERYKALAAHERPDMVFAGRLADYRYYDMDQAVLRALLLFRKLADRLAGATVGT